VLYDADYGDNAPAGTHAGSSFPALWPGGSNDVYAQHGSTDWIQIALADVAAGLLLAAIIWRGPVRFLRRRGLRMRRVPP
jgi:hypothetical protein